MAVSVRPTRKTLSFRPGQRHPRVPKRFPFAIPGNFAPMPQAKPTKQQTPGGK
jgi:hypothetical protein